MNPGRIAPAALLLLSVVCWASPQAATRPSRETQCAQGLEKWRQRFEAKKFNGVVSPPFVIAGNGTSRQIERYRDRTVRPAADALHAMYFQKEPTRPILILLFEDEAGYRRLAKAWCGDENVSHYGYFRHDNVMLMNVATGLGTLVHELTHAMIQPNFPNVPSWFNEGLASLYEQSTMGEKSIRCHENWRLPALQTAIKQDKLRPLRELMEDDDFYDEAHARINYAEARYLMLYLQEKGLLQKYYVEFRDHVKGDPDGVASLKRIIAPAKLDAFEKEWRAWVLTLRFN